MSMSIRYRVEARSWNQNVIGFVEFMISSAITSTQRYATGVSLGSAIANALTRGAAGECYILAHENLTYREFFAKLSKVTKTAGRKIPVPASVLNAFGALSGFLAPSKTPLDSSNAVWLCTGHYYSGAKAVCELGLPQTPIETAVAEAVDWFLQKGYLS